MTAVGLTTCFCLAALTLRLGSVLAQEPAPPVSPVDQEVLTDLARVLGAASQLNGTNPCNWLENRGPIQVTCQPEGGSNNTPRVARVQLLVITGTGSYPNADRRFPIAGNLSEVALDRLNLSSFTLTNAPDVVGTVSPSWPQAWPALGTLYIQNTGLSGELPEEWGAPGAWPTLGTLQLSGSRFEVMCAFWGAGTLPAWTSFGPPAAPAPGSYGGYLSALDVSNNQLTGTIPQGWLTNVLSAPLGTNLETGTRFIDVNVSSNRLTGSLPADFGAPSPSSTNVVRKLFLDHNALTGTVAASLGSTFSNLLFLGLHNNNFTGAIPADWSEGFANTSGSEVAVEVFLESNNFSGLVPPSFYDDRARTDYHRVYYVQPGNSGLCSQRPAQASNSTIVGGVSVCAATPDPLSLEGCGCDCVPADVRPCPAS